jgi:hypothetical protein
MPPGLTGGADYLAALDDRVAGLTRYWNAKPRLPAYASTVSSRLDLPGDTYYDDNAWIALALVQRFRMGLTASLDRPHQLFSFARGGWDVRPDSPLPGGVYWVEQGIGNGRHNHDRGAGCTAGSAALGFHLLELTGSAGSDADRQVSPAQMVDWVATHLDSSHDGTGPFWNVVRRDGSIDTNIWSYNQGVMLGARVVQYRLTGDPVHLGTAERIARQALGTFGDFTGQPPSFNAMCFQNLLMLHAATPDATLKAEILRRMQGYADWTWDAHTGARDAATALFSFDDAGRPAHDFEHARLQDQGAMAQLYALLAWDPADYAKLT